MSAEASGLKSQRSRIGGGDQAQMKFEKRLTGEDISREAAASNGNTFR